MSAARTTSVSRARRPLLETLEDRCLPADLAALAPSILSGPVRWGESVRVQSFVTNDGTTATGPFNVQIRLSRDAHVDASDPVLQSTLLSGIAAGGLGTSELTFALPAVKPAGWADDATAYLAFVVDSDDAILESDEANNVSFARLPLARTAEQEPNSGPDTSTPIALNTTVAGSISASTDVDWFSIEVTTPGWLTVEVTPTAGSSLDPAVELHSELSQLELQGLRHYGGGVLYSSDDRSATDDRPFLHIYLMPGRFSLAVSGSGERRAGDYTLETTFESSLANPFGITNSLGNFLPVGSDPSALLVADFNRDGVLDLVTANADSGDVSVLLGVDGGAFQDQQRFAVTGWPTALAVDDFNHDGRPDLLALDGATGRVTVLLGLGDGQFRRLDATIGRSEVTSTVFTSERVLVRDINGDGEPEIIGPNLFPGAPPDTLVVLVGTPAAGAIDVDLTRSPYFAALVAVGGSPSVSLSAVADSLPPSLADRSPPVPVRSTPLSSDLTGDGTLDAVVVNRKGDILLRPGVVGLPGSFGAPILINADPDLPRARELVVLANDRLAALDLRGSLVSIYDRIDGTWERTLTLPAGFLPFRIATADVNGDGRLDLAVGDTYLGAVAIFTARADGGFDFQTRLKAGVALADVQFADADGDGRPDILVTDVTSGTVGVMLNRTEAGGAVSFLIERRYVGGGGPHGVLEGPSGSGNYLLAQPEFARAFLTAAGITDPGVLDTLTQQFQVSPPFYTQYTPYSKQETGAVIAADFTGDGIVDLVAVNTATNTIGLLRGKAGGGFVDPIDFDGPGRPTVVKTGDFDGDDDLDLAILDEKTASVTIYLGDGHGHFTEHLSPDIFGVLRRLGTGTTPTGLTLADVASPNGGGPDGILDLLVGNEFGDLLTMAGNGDGTFRLVTRYDRRVPLAVTRTGDGRVDIVLASEVGHLVSEQVGIIGSSRFQDGSFQKSNGADGLLAPAAVLFADLDGRYGADLIVANSGGNNVLVYLRGADGRLAERPLSFAVGTTPTALNVSDLNGDGILDLVVANAGSNDVSVLMGATTAAEWTFAAGPRLQAPVAGLSGVDVRDVTGDGIADLIASGSNGYTILPGLPERSGERVGSGFFDDSIPRTIDVGERINHFEIVDTTHALALNSNGALTTIDLLSGLLVTAFDPGAGRNFTTFRSVENSAFVVAAGIDGTVWLLEHDSAGYQELAQLHTDNAFASSDLHVFLSSASSISIYLTDADELRPIELTFDLRTTLMDVGPSDSNNTIPLPLALAVTLVSSLPDDDAPATAPSSSIAYFPLLERGLFLPPTIGAAQDEAAFEATQAVSVNDPEQASVGSDPFLPTPDAVDRILTGLDEAFERLGWQSPEGPTVGVGDFERTEATQAPRAIDAPIVPASVMLDDLSDTPDHDVSFDVPAASVAESRVELSDLVMAGGLLMLGAITWTEQFRQRERTGRRARLAG